ncbi:MAG TPA: hypothetical protein VL200_00950 [Lacunisphaera sp.]|nr:hypothetical protein [Lacunisphaera sp.]
MVAFAAALLPARAAIRSYPLEARTVYAIRISREAPTTCVFPGPLTALEGAGVSTKPEDGPAVLLSHQAGAGFFTVRALQENASAALNVVFRDRVYALSFSVAADPDRTVVFEDQADEKRDGINYAGLIEQARTNSRLPEGGGRLEIDRTEPGSTTCYPNFRVTIAEVCRFEDEDALVFRLRLENPAEKPVRYDPAGLAVRVGFEVYPAKSTDASGAIPARGNAEAWIVIARNAAGGRADLTVHEAFSILVPSSPAP